MNLYEKINAAIAEMPNVETEERKKVPYPIVSHDQITVKCRPILRKHGIAVLPRVRQIEAHNGMLVAVVDVELVNIEDPTERHIVSGIGAGSLKDDKAPGKAMSYAVKYALLKGFSMTTGEDADYEQVLEADRPDPRLEEAEAGMMKAGDDLYQLTGKSPFDLPKIIQKPATADDYDANKLLCESAIAAWHDENPYGQAAEA